MYMHEGDGCLVLFVHAVRVLGANRVRVRQRQLTTREEDAPARQEVRHRHRKRTVIKAPWKLMSKFM